MSSSLVVEVFNDLDQVGADVVKPHSRAFFHTLSNAFLKSIKTW